MLIVVQFQFFTFIIIKILSSLEPLCNVCIPFHRIKYVLCKWKRHSQGKTLGIYKQSIKPLFYDMFNVHVCFMFKKTAVCL